MFIIWSIWIILSTDKHMIECSAGMGPEYILLLIRKSLRTRCNTHLYIRQHPCKGWSWSIVDRIVIALNSQTVLILSFSTAQKQANKQTKGKNDDLWVSKDNRPISTVQMKGKSLTDLIRCTAWLKPAWFGQHFLSFQCYDRSCQNNSSWEGVMLHTAFGEQMEDDCKWNPENGFTTDNEST